MIPKNKDSHRLQNYKDTFKMTNKQYTTNPKIAILSNLYDTPPSLIHEISNNKYRIRRNIYRIYTLHQLYSNEQSLPDYDIVITFGYDQYYIKKEK